MNEDKTNPSLDDIRRQIEDLLRKSHLKTVVEYAKRNIVLLGPTGAGKTYLMRCVARLIGVPFVKSDATKFSETGYVGHDVEDLVRDLVRIARGLMTVQERVFRNYKFQLPSTAVKSFEAIHETILDPEASRKKGFAK